MKEDNFTHCVYESKEFAFIKEIIENMRNDMKKWDKLHFINIPCVEIINIRPANDNIRKEFKNKRF